VSVRATLGPEAAAERRGVPAPPYFSRERVGADADALVAAVDGSTAAGAGLRRAYLRAVAKAQRQPFELAAGDEPSLLFDLAEPEVEKALSYLLGEEPPDPVRPLESSARSRTRERFEAAWEMLRVHAPDLLAPVEVLVGRYVFADCPAREGQTSLRNALGTVFWISPSAAWRPPHFADAIVHEATHQALFLTDMVHRCFTVGRAGLDDPAAQALSSVRAIPRPYDLAFHAACVDAVLLALFDLFGNRAELERRTASLAPALADLKAKEEFLTPFGRQILSEAQATFDAASRSLDLQEDGSA
jgi:hypothetical protein